MIHMSIDKPLRYCSSRTAGEIGKEHLALHIFKDWVMWEVSNCWSCISHDAVSDVFHFQFAIRGLFMKCSPQYYVACLVPKWLSLENLGVVRMVMLWNHLWKLKMEFCIPLRRASSFYLSLRLLFFMKRYNGLRLQTTKYQLLVDSIWF